jgi:hypothetical protein
MIVFGVTSYEISSTLISIAGLRDPCIAETLRTVRARWPKAQILSVEISVLP